MINLNLNYFKNLSLNELGLWLLIPFASLISHTWLPIPPTMMLLFGAIVCWIFQHFNNHKSKIDQYTDSSIHQGIILFSIFCLYLFASQYLINAPFRRYMGAVLAPLYFVLILLFPKDVSADFLKKLARKFIHYSLIILSVEVVLRYSYNIWLISHDINYFQGIYLFKFDGPMYGTSNIVATHLILVMFFIFWWNYVNKQFLKKELVVTLVLLVLTLSRATIPAVALGLCYYYFFKHLNWKNSLLVLFSVGVIGISILLTLKFFIADASFQSKFLIFEEAWIYYQTANLKDILFGIGFFQSDYIMTFYAHNYFLMFLMESGVFGLLFLCLTLFYLIKATNGAAMIVLLPFFIQSASESVVFMPHFYVIMGLLVLFANKNRLYD